MEPTRRPRHDVTPHLLAAVVGMVLALLAATAAPAWAAGAGPTAQVPGGADVATVTITELRPGLATTADVLRIEGVLANTGDAPLVDPLPALRWSSDPLQGIDEVDLVATNPLFRYGRVDYRYSDPLATLEAGDEAAFALEVPLDDLPIGPGAYVVGVDVLATLPDGLRVFVASDRTTVPIDVEVDAPLPVAMLWPLASAPTLLPDGRLTGETLAEELSQGGRLTQLLAAAEGSEVTWLVDPDLVITTAAMADGSTTVGSDAAGSTASSAASDAARYLSELSDALSGAVDVRQTPLADVDVGGSLAAGRQAATIEESIAEGAGDGAVAGLADRAVPALANLVDRPVTSQMLAVYVGGGVEAAVVSPGSVTSTRADGPVTLTVDEGPAVDAVVARVPPATATGPGPRAELAARQWMLSATAVTALAPADDPSMVVAPPVRWSPDPASASALLTAWRDADWVEPVSLATVTTGIGQSGRDVPAVTLAPAQEPTPLPPQTSEGLVTLVQDAQRLEPLFAEPILSDDALPGTLSRATSYAWQDDPAAGTAYLGAVTSTITGVEDQIGLVVSPSITLSSRSGRFPITLVNDANADVVVGVEFTSQNSSRLRVEDIEPIVLTSGEKRTVTATALATANGRLQVTATLVSTERAPVGAPVSTIVDVTNVGALGWTVIGAGGVMLVAALVRSRLRGRRVREAT
jgi:hypothetical protein